MATAGSLACSHDDDGGSEDSRRSGSLPTLCDESGNIFCLTFVNFFFFFFFFYFSNTF